MGNGTPEAVRADAESWDAHFRWVETCKRMDELAKKAGGVRTRQQDLKKGDRFLLYLDNATSVCPAVYVWDKLEGCGYAHLEETGEKGLMTGEMEVVKLERSVLPSVHPDQG